VQESEYGKEINRLLVHIINILNFYQIMDKKELIYVSPEVEVVYLEQDVQLLAGSPNPDDPFDGSSSEPDIIE
jgi:hypothetical protein